MLEIWGTPMEIELDRNFEERGNSVWGVLRCRYLKFLCSHSISGLERCLELSGLSTYR